MKQKEKMDIKICGIKDETILHAAIEAGANFIGFVFYPPSPRYVTFEEAAALSAQMPGDVEKVGLFVDPSDEEIMEAANFNGLTMLQLHGNESPQRLKEIKALYDLPVIKALRVAEKADIEQARHYEETADWLLFDTKTEGTPGGTGQTFDWSVLQSFESARPWMLSGGLNAGNIRQALRIISPDAVDVSSGVEDSPGIKSPEKIAEFMRACHQIEHDF